MLVEAAVLATATGRRAGVELGPSATTCGFSRGCAAASLRASLLAAGLPVVVAAISAEGIGIADNLASPRSVDCRAAPTWLAAS
jgi:hypothetical protein